MAGLILMVILFDLKGQSESIDELKREIIQLRERVGILEREKQERERQGRRREEGVWGEGFEDFNLDSEWLSRFFEKRQLPSIKKIQFQKVKGGYRLAIPLSSREKEVNVEISNGKIIIKQSLKKEYQQQGQRQWRQSSSFSSSSQSLAIPQGTDVSQIKTEEKDGQLLIFLPFSK